MKNESETAAILNEFEGRNDVYALIVGGMSVWRLVRGSVGYAIQDLPLSGPRLSRIELLSASLVSVWQLGRLKISESRGYLVKSYASALRLKQGDRYGDVYFESLLEQLPRGVRMHALNAGGYARRTHQPSAPDLDCTAVRVLGGVLARLLPRSDQNHEFSRLSNLIVAELGQEGFTPRWIARFYSSIWWQSRVYEWILKKVRPRVVIAADTSERALIAACRRQGIRFIELQHGVFNPEDPDCLPAAALDRCGHDALLLPDAMAVFGDYWREAHSGTAMGRIGRLHVVGSNAVDRFRRMRQEHFVTDPDCPRLLVTTQGMDRDSLVAFLLDFLKQCDRRFVLQIKLHPIYDKSPEPYVEAFAHDPRVLVLSGTSDPDTFPLIAVADLHISIASACHFDALGIGVPTVVIPLAGHEVVLGLVERGDALLAHAPAELAAIVTQRAWGRVEKGVSDHYFKGGFVDHLSSLMARLEN